LRVLRIAAPVQLRLDVGADDGGSWWELPEATRAEVLVVLGRLIARGIVAGEEGGDD